MPRERITRRQKNISRLLRERKQIHKDKIKSSKKSNIVLIKGAKARDKVFMVNI